MIFRVRPPSRPLQRHVEYFWYHEGVVSDYAMERLLPDGAVELIVDLREGPKRWNELGEPRIQTVRRAWISGQHSRPIAIEAAQDSCMIGARFRPGGAWAVLGQLVSVLNDDVVEMELLWGRASLDLRDRLLETRGVDERFAVLDAALLARAHGRLEIDRSLACALQRLRRAPECATIGSLAREIGVSHHRLLHLFEEHVGLKPKMLARVLRFQRVLQRLEREPRLTWAALAAEYGYFDQPHFVNEFGAFSGLRPTQYLRDKGEYLNFLPIRTS